MRPQKMYIRTPGIPAALQLLESSSALYMISLNRMCVELSSKHRVRIEGARVLCSWLQQIMPVK